MKTQLNTGKSIENTFFLIREFDNKRTNLIVVNGVRVGSGYQKYITPSYFVRSDNFPKDAQEKLKEIYQEKGWKLK
jgi:hypothetical protein